MGKSVLWLLLGQIFFSTYCLASEGHHAGGNEIPITVILFQILNLIVIFGLGIYFLRTHTVVFFQNRQSQYKEMANKANLVKQEAEKVLLDIQSKINQLDSGRDESLAKAKLEADQLRSQIIEEANLVAKRVSQDAKVTLANEYQKAQHKIKEAMLTESLNTARTLLSKDIGSSDHHKLQTDFVQNVEVVI